MEKEVTVKNLAYIALILFNINILLLFNINAILLFGTIQSNKKLDKLIELKNIELKHQGIDINEFEQLNK